METLHKIVTVLVVIVIIVSAIGACITGYNLMKGEAANGYSVYVAANYFRLNLQVNTPAEQFYAMAATDAGGVDTYGLFLCAASGHMSDSGEWVQDWRNPLIDIFPSIFSDC